MFCWTVHVKGGQQPNGYPAVAVENEVYSFGGPDADSTAQIDVHVFNTVSLRWRKLTPVTTGRHLQVPSRRRGHTAVLIEHIVYIWGGYSTCGTFVLCDVLYAFDVDTHGWFKPRVSGAVPGSRCDHSACVLGKVMYIHGGWILHYGHYGMNNDIYKLDTSTIVWSLINTRGTVAPVSLNHSATFFGTKMFVFGGWGDSGLFNTIRLFDTETNCWINTPPEGRWGHSASAFTYSGQLYVFGGHKSFQRTFNDLWRVNPETFSWKKAEPKGKGPGPGRSMRCCMVGDRIILFGGDKTPDDLYVLDLNPSLKTLCKLAVNQYGLEQSGIPHNIRWELAAMTNYQQG